jgi:hypothetical protein
MDNIEMKETGGMLQNEEPEMDNIEMKETCEILQDDEACKVLEVEELAIQFEKLSITGKASEGNVSETESHENPSNQITFVDVLPSEALPICQVDAGDGDQADLPELPYDQLSQDSCGSYNSYDRCSDYTCYDDSGYDSDCDSNNSWF